MEKKLDRLLADMPKRKYDLDAWLVEDETATFDRIVRERCVSGGCVGGADGKTIGNKQHPFWRWVAAAACLLLIIGIVTTLWPTKQENKPLMTTTVQPKVEEVKPEEPKVEKIKVEPTKRVIAKHRKQKQKPVTPTLQRHTLKERTVPKPLMDQESAPGKAVGDLQLAVNHETKAKSQELTERDIPITRPENYKYTPEEIALMKRQAAEAYLKWVKLELEIAKHSQEQTAQY